MNMRQQKLNVRKDDYPGRLALNVAEAVRTSGLGRSTLYAALRTGKLRARKCGRRTIILTEDLGRFLTSLPNKEANDA